MPRNNNPNDAGTSIQDADEDTIRICLATDLHLGFAESDAVRGNDSFAALEEILYLAKHYACDMVLLAGDLFHENKPSRRTMYKAMSIFRKYCMGPNPIAIQILSDESLNFRQGQANYRNQFYSVDLPVMSIHGNHDDPSREGADLYAALDLLDCANLVNYIGRQDEINQIQVSPILLKKGTTHLALYALGSMRDERLNRMWQGSNLTFLRPESDDVDAPEYFNLFTLHQNRDRGRGTKNCVQETMIPEWMDLVCWGHEHECCIEPQESVVGTFRITQPGSSIATSLVAGEAARKHIGILDVRGQAFRLGAIPLTQVRSFVLGEISLRDHPRLDPDDPKVEQKVKQILHDQVDLLIHQAREKHQELKEAAIQNANILPSLPENPLSNFLEKPEEVLVRLKVEHSGFSALNNQRFGAQFIGQVANAVRSFGNHSVATQSELMFQPFIPFQTDILLFQRKKGAISRNMTNKVKKLKPISPDVLEEMNIEELIVRELDLPDRKLELFDEKIIATALQAYVDKQQAQAIPEVVSSLLGKQQKILIKQGTNTALVSNEESVRSRNKASQRNANQLRGGIHDVADVEESCLGDSVESTAETRKVTKSNRSGDTNPKRRKLSTKRSIADYSDYDEDFTEETANSRKGAARGQKAGFRYKESSSEESPSFIGGAKNRSHNDDNSEVDDCDEVEDWEPPEKREVRSRGRVVTSTGAGLGTNSSQSLPLSRSRKRPGRGQKQCAQNNSEIVDNNFTPRSYDLEDDWGIARTDTFEE